MDIYVVYIYHKRSMDVRAALREHAETPHSVCHGPRRRKRSCGLIWAAPAHLISQVLRHRAAAQSGRASPSIRIQSIQIAPASLWFSPAGPSSVLQLPPLSSVTRSTSAATWAPQPIGPERTPQQLPTTDPHFTTRCSSPSVTTPRRMP